MLRLSVIKSCFVFPDGVSLPLGWGWRPRCCGRGGRVALTSDWGRLSLFGPVAPLSLFWAGVVAGSRGIAET